MLRAFTLFISFLLIQTREIRASPIGTGIEEGPVDAGHIVPRQTCTPDFTYDFISDGPIAPRRVNRTPSGWASLAGTVSVGQNYTYTQSTTGSYFTASTCTTTSYLTLDTSSTASYKQLIWTSTPQTNYWVVTSGAVLPPWTVVGKLHTTSTSPFGDRDTFIACGPFYILYLQTGSDVPPSTTCQTVHLFVIESL
ncbi:hypothetical protein FRC03_009583 [Tulasnella sp. 419]|nr:hypothetical protein FRC03_009583 [Tulasnella sp. 419]